MNDEGKTDKAKRGFMRTTTVGLILLVGLLAAVAGMAFPAAAYFLLWGVGEVVIPVWEAVDPTAPRLPTMPKDVAEFKDANGKGKALRTTVDRFYASLPETNKSWLREVLAPPYVGSAVDISKIVQHYIPVGTSFSEAERILEAAGINIAWPRRSEADAMVLGNPPNDYPVRGALEQNTDPAGYMRVYVRLLPQTAGDYGDAAAVGKVTATLSKQVGAPVPPVSFSFDVSRASTNVDVLIKIVESRFYQFDLTFRSSRPSDTPSLRKVAGGGGRWPDGRHEDPGIIIPIRITVANDGQPPFYDRMIDTQGTYKFSYLEISRGAGGIELSPGIYRIRAITTKDIPELSKVKVDLTITYDARF